MWCDKLGNNKGMTKNLDDLLSTLVGSNNKQVYNIKSNNIKSNTIVNNLQKAIYFNDINNGNTIYIKQFVIPYLSNTTLYNDSVHNKSITAIIPNTKYISYTLSGCGGQFSTIYMNNNLSNIDNIFCIAGGGGGSGIYSARNFNATESIFDGHDGCALVKKIRKTIQVNELKGTMNYMNGGSCGVYNSFTQENNKNPVYEIPGGSLGGSVHTFKNLFEENVELYAKPDGKKFGANYGFYPNFVDVKVGNKYIKIPPINGKPFKSVKGYTVLYKGQRYEVDSFGLEKSGDFFGNGGSALQYSIFTTHTPPMNNWGNKDNSINYKHTNKKTLVPYIKAYSQGGGGGGGFGGGSAGTYFFYQQLVGLYLSNPVDQLNNIPPGGGGGGNSFYNVQKHNGLAYGMNSEHIKSNDKNIPSILPQMLKLAMPNIKSFTNNQYLQGKKKMYLYIYTGNG
jgi:hypothetical protein